MAHLLESVGFLQRMEFSYKLTVAYNCSSRGSDTLGAPSGSCAHMCVYSQTEASFKNVFKF